MNVSKIQGLSDEYESLNKFLDVCNNTDVELKAKRTAQAYGEITLSSYTTKGIIVKVRNALLDKMKVIEAEIGAEATKL